MMIAMMSAIASNAEEGFGTCKIQGTDDYVEGTAYLSLSGSTLSGNLVISNASRRPLQSASISVSVTYKWKEAHQSPYDGGKVVNNYDNTVSVYSSRWTGNIAGYQSGQIQLSKAIRLPQGAYDVAISDISVTINNPYCK